MMEEIKGVRVIVCGGRYYADEAALFAALDAFHAGPLGPIKALAHGAAKGADTLAGKWAEARGIGRETYPANWERDGKSAGVRRNERMLLRFRPDRVIAFPGGVGTADMVRRAKEDGVPVTTVATPLPQ